MYKYKFVQVFDASVNPRYCTCTCRWLPSNWTKKFVEAFIRLNIERERERENLAAHAKKPKLQSRLVRKRLPSKSTLLPYPYSTKQIYPTKPAYL